MSGHMLTRCSAAVAMAFLSLRQRLQKGRQSAGEAQ